MPNNAPRGGLTVAVAVPSSLTLDAALDYAARGWRVFPCKPSGKLPLTKKGRALVATAGRKGLEARLRGSGVVSRAVVLKPAVHRHRHRR